MDVVESDLSGRKRVGERGQANRLRRLFRDQVERDCCHDRVSTEIQPGRTDVVEKGQPKKFHQTSDDSLPRLTPDLVTRA